MVEVLVLKANFDYNGAYISTTIEQSLHWPDSVYSILILSNRNLSASASLFNSYILHCFWSFSCFLLIYWNTWCCCYCFCVVASAQIVIFSNESRKKAMKNKSILNVRVWSNTSCEFELNFFFLFFSSLLFANVTNEIELLLYVLFVEISFGSKS